MSRARNQQEAGGKQTKYNIPVFSYAKKIYSSLSCILKLWPLYATTSFSDKKIKVQNVIFHPKDEGIGDQSAEENVWTL